MFLPLDRWSNRLPVLMTLGLLNPNAALSTETCNLPTQTASFLHSTPPISRHNFAMSNVPSQPDDDASNKDAFDPSSSLRNPTTSLNPHHDITTPRHSLPFPPQQLHHLPPQPLSSTNPSHHPSPGSTLAHHQNPIGASTIPYGAAAVPLDTRPRDHLQTYDLFPDISVAPVVPAQEAGPSTFTHDARPPPPHHHHHHQQPPHHSYSNPRLPHAQSSAYASIPLPASSSRITKRTSRAPEGLEQSSSPSAQSPSQRATAGQSSLERRKAHRAYTQKSRNKVNSRFEALLDALPTPPPRLNPRSKAEILEYATETVIRLVSQNNKLELSLALSSTPHLEAWLTDQTQHARTVREVCQPIMRLFTIGLEWKGAEAWAIDSRAPMNQAALGQAWTFVPPPTGRSAFRDDDNNRISELTTFLDSAKGTYYETASNEALAVVYRTGKPAWLSCEYKTFIGFDDSDFATDRTRMALTYGISDALFVPLILYNHVQIVVNFYNMRSRSPSGNPSLQPQTDPKSAIKVATEAIAIIARRFCSLPGVSEFADK